MAARSLTNGFFAGSLFFVWKMGVLFLGKQYDWFPQFPAGPLLFLVGVFVFLSIVRFSDSSSTLFDDFKSGARTALTAALTAGIGVYAYYAWFDPEFMPARIQESLDAAKASGTSPEDLINAEIQMQKLFSPFTYSTLTVSATAFFGMAFSLIVSGLKRAFKVL
jgi:hypothetical protein